MKYDIVIVGGGIMGASTALYLSLVNKSILLIDPFHSNDFDNASLDYSKTLRYAYGSNKFYTKLLQKSFNLWKEIELLTKTKLLHSSNFVFLSNNKEKFIIDSEKTLYKLGCPFEILNKKSLNNKYPQFNAEIGLEDKGAKIINSSLALRAIIKKAEENGVKTIASKVLNIFNNKGVNLDNGDQILFDKLVLTCGHWTKDIISSVPISLTKQRISYFLPKNKHEFVIDNFPQFAYLDNGFHGFPMIGTKGVKIGNHKPNTMYTDLENNIFKENYKEFFQKYIPTLEKANLISTNFCYYDMTLDKNFIIDYIEDNIIIATGFSGHGFKFAPAIGKIISDMVLKEIAPIKVFKLDRKYEVSSNVF